MAGVGKAQADVVGQLDVLPVLAGHQQLQGGLRIGNGVQRLHWGLARALALLVFPLGVALLNVGGVPQHNGQQLGGEPGTVDVAGEALLDQQRHPAGVVDVGVSDDNVVDVSGAEIQHAVVPFIPPLRKLPMTISPMLS